MALFMEFPIVFCPKTPVGWDRFGPEPKDTVAPVIAHGPVMDVHGGVVFRQHIHQFIEEMKIGDDTGIVLIQEFPVP